MSLKMLVVSDTSPISNLIVIKKLSLLREVFDTIIIPESVNAEINELVKFNVDLSEFINASWIRKEPIHDMQTYQRLIEVLDKGEAQAITIAHEINPDFLLIDEKKGRAIAKAMGIKTIGLIGILIKAKRENIIHDVKSIVDELREIARFRISDELYNEILKSVNE